MAPCEVSATCKATPETIWNTVFEPMKWESWDPDLNAVSAQMCRQRVVRKVQLYPWYNLHI